MKSLSSFICESIKSAKIGGTKTVKCESKEYGVSYTVKSNKWQTVTFELYGDSYIGYYCPEESVVFYHKVGTTDWASVSPMEPGPIDPAVFDNFEDFLMNGATVPEYEKFNTNLENTSVSKIAAVKTTSAPAGMKYVKCKSFEYNVRYDIKSSKWKSVNFKLYDSPYIGYYCPEESVVFYHKVGTTDWASVASANTKPITDRIFKNFEEFLLNNVTVPEYDVFETNLEKSTPVKSNKTLKSPKSFKPSSMNKAEKIRGVKTVKCKSHEYGVSYNIKSNKWQRTAFELYGDQYIGYYCPEELVVFYHKVGTTDWASVSPMEPEPITEQIFKDFEDFLMNGATVPEYEKFDTNLE